MQNNIIAACLSRLGTSLTLAIRTTPMTGVSLSIAGMVLIALFYWSTVPVIGTVTYQQGGKAAQSATLPFAIPSDGPTLSVDMTLLLPSIHPGHFAMRPDDCIEDLQVNGQVVPVKSPQLCFRSDSKRVDLSAYLHQGQNSLHFTLSDIGGQAGLKLQPSVWDPLYLSLLIAFFLCIATLWFSLQRLWKREAAYGLWLTFLLGIFLRTVYALSVDHSTRSYDSDAHVEYVRYVLSHWSIPPAQGGWEFYQPPFYYFLSAGWMRLLSVLGTPENLLVDSLSILSLLLSFLTLGIGAWIAHVLFPKSGEYASRCFFLGILSTFPGLLFMTTRINNDVLFVPVALVFVGMLLRWWMLGKNVDWHLASIAAGVAFLVKTNALVLPPIALLSVFLRRGMSLRKKIPLAAAALLIIGLLTGWFLVMRFIIEKETFIVGNHRGLNGALGVQNTVRHLTGFNPFAIIDLPYNSSWSDEEGRQFFWEHLFKSGFVGEWNFGNTLRPLVSMMEGTGLILLFLALWHLLNTLTSLTRGEQPSPGTGNAPRWQYSPALHHHSRILGASQESHELPLAITFLLLLAAAFCYRLFSPFASNQDFRFIPLIVLPFAFFAAKVPEHSSPSVRLLARCSMLAFIALCTFYICVLLYGT